MSHLDGSPYANTSWGCKLETTPHPYSGIIWNQQSGEIVQPITVFTSDKFNIYKEPNQLTQYTDFHLLDQYNQEWMSRGASKILIYKIDLEKTVVDDVWGEPENNIVYKPPIRVDGVYELEPIIQELNKFGIEENETITILFNMTNMLEKLNGEYIKRGDILKLFLTSPREINLENDPQSKTMEVRYIQKILRVYTAIPTKLVNYNYLMWQVTCSKSNLDMELLPEGDD